LSSLGCGPGLWGPGPDAGPGGPGQPPFQPAGEGTPARRLSSLAPVAEPAKVGLAIPVGGAVFTLGYKRAGNGAGPVSDLIGWRALDPRIARITPLGSGPTTPPRARLYGLAEGLTEIDLLV